MLRWKRQRDRSIFDDEIMAIMLVSKQLRLGLRLYRYEDNIQERCCYPIKVSILRLYIIGDVECKVERSSR